MRVTKHRAPGARGQWQASATVDTSPRLERVWTVVASFFGRPPGVVERMRWLFTALAATALELVVLTTILVERTELWLGVAGTGAVLWVSWIVGYRRRIAPFWMDLVDTVALAVLALQAPASGAITSVAFAAVLFRSQYGSLRRSLLRAVMFSAAVGAVVALWPIAPGRDSLTSPTTLLTSVPMLLFAAWVGSQLAETVRVRERSVLQQTAVGAMGERLLTTTDPRALLKIANDATNLLCEVTPGLAVIQVNAEGDGLTAVFASGGMVLPTVLPADLLAALEKGDSTCDGAPDARACLEAAAGGPRMWAVVPIEADDPAAGRIWILVGAPKSDLPDALTAIGSIASLVTLAMRNSVVHRDLRVMAEVDGLTGLANRAAFHAALMRDRQGGVPQETSVLFVDLDNFKDVNDVHGHQAGDDLLRVMATRLLGATRPTDMCARIGGDEFAVLLPGTGDTAAAVVARRVIESLSTPAILPGVVVHVGASVGVATVLEGEEPAVLVHRADVAMYAAKAQGKRRVQVFEPSLLNGDQSRVVFEQDLAAALMNGQMVVHYQPVIEMDDGRCTAVEALARWQHPQRGLLQPDAFIEVAERIGAIAAIGVAVLRQAVADASTWPLARSGMPLAVHVNVSALQLDDASFSVAVADCLRDFDWPANRLVLEFTESIMISSPHAIDRLRALAASGVVIAIDDFGTGYASLTTLRSLPVQIVKIDKSFVAGSTENMEDRAVIEGIVTMVKRLGVKVVAEGVETLEQRNLLMSMGVHEAQGFLYVNPRPAATFAGWLVEQLRVAEAVDRA